jgi:hypothetical protein
MSQNTQLLNEQNVNSVKYKINKDHPTNKSEGELKGENSKKAKEDYQNKGPLRSDGSPDSQARRLDHMSSGQRQLMGAIRL